MCKHFFARTFCVILVLTVAFSFSAYAQKRGGQQSQQGQQSAGQGQQTNQQDRDRQMDRDQQMDRDRIRDKDQLRQKIRATDQQRDQLNTCIGTADRIRKQAQDMKRSSQGSGFNVDQAKQQREQLRSQLQVMQQEHERFMQGLNGEQRAYLQNQIRKMEQSRERINVRLQEMEQELGKGNPNRDAVNKQFREIEKEMNQWHKQYRNASQEMGGLQ